MEKVNNGKMKNKTIRRYLKRSLRIQTTRRSGVLPEKMTAVQLLKKFTAFLRKPRCNFCADNNRLLDIILSKINTDPTLITGFFKTY
jgi:hypothetical protein